MCTAINYKTKDMYFGRTLDYEFSYGEKIVIVPRNYSYNFKYQGINNNHYAIIGMAHVDNSYPLFYEAANEMGLGIAGLNFVGNAKYNDYKDNYINIPQYEFISYILSNYKNITEVKKALKNINITNDPYSNFPIAYLHWLISDTNSSITVEVTSNGLMVYDNPLGVLANNPEFPIQLFNLNNYRNLSTKDPINSFNNQIELNRYSRGMGGIGLPGDLSSMSRFVRVAFSKLNSKANEDEVSSVNQFFHILNNVAQIRGLCEVNDSYEITIYTSCINLNKGIYYYNTYNNHQINKVDMYKTNLDLKDLYIYEFIDKEVINSQN